MKRAVICVLAASLFAASPALAQDEEYTPPEPRIEAPLDPAAGQAVEGINAFSLTLYKRAVVPGQNLFLSPASVSTAVALAYRGARGATADELRTVLRYGLPSEAYLPAVAPVLRSLDFAGAGRELHVSNAVWLETDLPLQPGFAADVARYAGAGLQRVAFRTDAEAARRTINDWVAASTRDKIRELLLPGDVHSGTRAALVNTIYWKGQWASPFAEGRTRVEPFTGLDGKRTPTSLMHTQDGYQVVERGGVKAIQLPFVSGEVSMVVLLPGAASALPRLESGLTDAALNRWLAALDAAPPRDTLLTLPKMHLEWRNDLVPTLKALGASTAFGDSADFSGMAGDMPDAAGLKIDKVIHQTFLDIDEKGSEAAAATAAVTDVVISGRAGPPTPPFVFRADKPFLFLLRDQRTNLILFIGRYVATTPAP